MLTSGVVPIVLFKVFASSTIKRIFPAIYTASVGVFRRKATERKYEQSTEGISTAHRPVDSDPLRRRLDQAQTPAPRDAEAEYLKISPWAALDTKVCVGA